MWKREPTESGGRPKSKGRLKEDICIQIDDEGGNDRDRKSKRNREAGSLTDRQTDKQNPLLRTCHQ